MSVLPAYWFGVMYIGMSLLSFVSYLCMFQSFKPFLIFYISLY